MSKACDYNSLVKALQSRPWLKLLLRFESYSIYYYFLSGRLLPKPPDYCFRALRCISPRWQNKDLLSILSRTNRSQKEPIRGHPIFAL